MFFKIQKNPKGEQVYLIDDSVQLKTIDLSKEEFEYAKKQHKAGQKSLAFNRFEYQLFLIFLDKNEINVQNAEAIRRQAAQFLSVINKLKSTELTLCNRSASESAAFHFAEGLALANYQFLKYKSDAKKLKNSLGNIYFDKESITPKSLNLLQVVTDAIFHVRNLVNEPLQYLTAEQFSKDLQELGKEGRFRVTVLEKAKIEQMKMGGILAVNRGSILPPTFTVMEHRPSKPINKSPIVLVGKGIVYDTGGLSLKPTANSMDRMKSDMSGGALVAGIMFVAGQLDLPIHLIALVPATENRPGQNAYVPGDVIKMYDGTTVEVLNTDAEGRLVLADALHYAKKYQPELVLDFATLTGAASSAIGDVGIVCMGNAQEKTKVQLKESGEQQYERLVEFPMWDEYGEMIKSDIADLKNIGGPTGGAITAGKFLEHFTDYPWMHFDIAGVSHHITNKDYRPSGGTAYGLRMIVDFLLNYKK